VTVPPGPPTSPPPPASVPTPSTPLYVTRSGRYLRVASPDWANPFDVTFTVRSGGRWNAPDSYGVLYLNATRAVASANARRWLATKGAITMTDLRPNRRPLAIPCQLPPVKLVDVVGTSGPQAVGLPPDYPWLVPHAICQPIGAQLRAAGEMGIACRSAAECSGPGQSVGEEAALFDISAVPSPAEPALAFDQWYDGPS
jgi:RES domain-containing protein